jgi:hypothetical protein
MAYLGRYGSTSPVDFAEMDPWETTACARRVERLREQEVKLQVTLAQFAAGAHLRAPAEEVR